MRAILFTILFFSSILSNVQAHESGQFLASDTFSQLQGPTGPTGPRGPRGFPGIDRPLTNTIFVDVSTTSTTQDGSISNPYSTIQAALNTIPPGTTVQEKLRSFSILIASGVYRENLVIDSNNNQIELIAIGSVYLADAMTLPIQSRSVVVNFLATTIPDPAIGFGDMVSFTDLNSSMFYKNSAAGEIGQLGQFIITGTLYINDVSTVVGAPNLVSYKGSIIGIPPGGTSPLVAVNGLSSTRLHFLNLDNATLISMINSPLSVINARDSVLSGSGGPSAIVFTYGIIDFSTISDGLTIYELPRNLLNNGSGIYSSNLAGTYQFLGGPSSSPNLPWLFDGATNYWRKQNGASILPTEVEVLFDGTP